MDVFTKFSPVKVSVKSRLPAMIDEGMIDDNEGPGF
jgi:hypothetical protein